MVHRSRPHAATAAGQDHAEPAAERYHQSDDIAGPVDPHAHRLTFRRTVDGRGRRVIATILAVDAVAVTAFVGLLIAHAAASPAPAHGYRWATWAALGVVVAAELLRLVQTCGLCVFASAARDPVPMAPQRGLRVAVLTTIVPAHEPVEMLRDTLAAMRKVQHDGTVDVWILDEGDDDGVRRLAAELGAHHFTRRGRPAYNSDGGTFAARTKAGNHNAWRAEHGAAYDVVAQVDPDHVPLPRFLARTLGYFRDPDVAFVVAPQVYGNTGKSFIARAAAALGYVFTGVVQRGGNGLGAPLLIGTNHLYRMSAWDQIGGYQDSIIEDHLTSVVVNGAVNPRTGRRWDGVYTPDVLAVGEGPSTWTDFFRQQDRWASGVWEILLRRDRFLLGRMRPRQRFAYVFLQSFYPTVGLCWIAGILASVLYLTGVAAGPVWGWAAWLPWSAWAVAALSWYVLFRWLTRYYLHADERRESVLLPWLMTILTAPVYAWSCVTALAGRRPAYKVTGKGRLCTGDTWRTFHAHLASAATFVLVIAFSLAAGTGGTTSRAWALFGLVVSAVLPLLVGTEAARRRVDGWLTTWTRGIEVPRPRGVEVPRPRGVDRLLGVARLLGEAVRRRPSLSRRGAPDDRRMSRRVTARYVTSRRVTSRRHSPISSA